MTEDDKLRLAREIAQGYRKNTDAEPQKKRRPGRRAKDAPQREDAVPLAEALQEFIESRGWDERLAVQRLFTDWESIVGPDMAQHTTVEGYEDQIVSIRTSSTAWATQVKLLAPRIVAKLNEELGQGLVLRIDVRGPQAPSWVSGKRSIKGRGPRDTYG